MTDQNNIVELLKLAQEQFEQLRRENAHLRAMLGIQNSAIKEMASPETNVVDRPNVTVAEVFTPDKKIALFRSLFRGREDVYAVRWEGKGGKSGYSPAGVMDWRAIHAARPEERKKVARKTRTLQPLTDSAIRDHLTGKQIIGIYPHSSRRNLLVSCGGFRQEILDGRCRSFCCNVPTIPGSSNRRALAIRKRCAHLAFLRPPSARCQCQAAWLWLIDPDDGKPS
jgi:hypothetical protein